MNPELVHAEKFGETSFLRTLVENELYIACPLISASEFATFCSDRGVKTSIQDLERLERLQVLFPVARIRRPKLTIKTERVADGSGIRELGILGDGETWDGETTQQHSRFSFRKEFAMEWLEEGRLWGPRSKPFQPWSSFKSSTWDEEYTTFYSMFQIYPLHHFRTCSSSPFRAEWYMCEEDDGQAAFGEWLHVARGIVERVVKEGIRGDGAAELCQVVSNRYYFSTQGDRRTIATTRPGDWYDWDWEQYRRSWSPTDNLRVIALDDDSVETIQSMLAMDATHVDPLRAWYDLVSFVAVDKKKRLRDRALLAQTLYSMEHMVRLLLEDLTGKPVLLPNESGLFSTERVYGEGVPANELEFLEYLANEYHLNPRPNLVFVVEGDGEEAEIPRIAERILGYSFVRFGIEVVNLRGIDNFQGRASKDRFGALEKFIDYHHHRQTIVYVLLDREGNAERVRENLLKRRSMFRPRRRVTKPEYVHIWQASIEFDNFSDAEIAAALTTLGEVISFTADEVCVAREATGQRRGDSLRELYCRKPGGPFSKSALLTILVDDLRQSTRGKSYSEVASERPIIKIVHNILGLASKNYQPTSRESWVENQESGYLGSVEP